MITKKDYEILKKYEAPLYSITHAGYARTNAEDWVDLAAVYERAFKKALTKNQLQCGECKKKALKMLAQEYYQKQSALNLNSKDKEPSDKDKKD